MANPYFNAVYYLQQNPDVFAAGYTVDTAWNHYAQFGANEGYANGGTVRAPNPWFDVKYYLNNNPDLIAAGITPAMALDHFTTYGMTAAEDRAPNATVAASPITEASLLAYANANADLQTAFGIPAGATELTAAQQNALISHFYQYGYDEDRPDAPTTVDIPDPNQGQTFTLTENGGTLTGTAGNDEFYATNTGTNARIDGAVLDGLAGTDKLFFQNTSAAAGNPGKVSNIEQVYVQSTNAGGNLNASNITGAEQFWMNGSTVDTTISNIQNNATLGLQGTGAGIDLTATFKDATFTAGSTLNVALNGAGASGAANAAALTVGHVATAGAATDLTLAIAAEGTNFVTYTNGAQKLGDLKVVNVSGAGAVTLAAAGAEFNGVRTYDASTSTGNVSITAGAFDATTNDIVVKGGSGNDTFNLAVATLGSKLTVNGGAGTDTVVVAGVAGNATGTGAAGAVDLTGKFTDVERLEIATTASSTTTGDFATVDASKVGGGSYVAVNDFGANIGAGDTVRLDLNNLANGATVNFKGSIGDTVVGTAGTVGVALNLSAAAKAADAPSLNVSIGAAGGAKVVQAATVDAAVKALTVVSTGTDANVIGSTTVATDLFRADSVETLTVSGDKTATLRLDMDKLKTVDTTGVTATSVTIDNTGSTQANNITWKMGTTREVLTLDAAGKQDIITYTAANQSTTSSTDSITGFVVAEDLINIAAISQGTFAWLGATAFAANAGNTQARYSDTNTLQIDLDGDATADMVITLAGGVADDLTAGNFQFA